MAVYWEPLHGFTVGTAGGSNDADSDSATHAGEFVDGTDPRSAGCRQIRMTLQGTCHGLWSGATGGPLRYHRFPPLQGRTGTACRKIRRRARMPLPASMGHESPALVLLHPIGKTGILHPMQGAESLCFMTQKIGPSRIKASFIALIYNWWHLDCRFYDETHNREAIITRPALMQGVGRRVESDGQKRIKVSILHQNADVITAAITAISKEISHIAATVEQWTISQRWLRCAPGRAAPSAPASQNRPTPVHET